MNIPYEALCKQHGIPYAVQSPRDMKHALLEKMLKSKDSAEARILLSQLPLKSESDLDEMLYRLYQEKRPARVKKQRQPELAVMLHADINRTKGSQRWLNSEETTAGYLRRQNPLWRDNYTNHEVMANAYYQVRSVVETLQKERDVMKFDMLAGLLTTFGNDKHAMALFRAFCRYWWQNAKARECGDIASLINAGNKLDRIFRVEHPFVLELAFLFAPVAVVWNLLAPRLEQLRQQKNGHKTIQSLLNTLKKRKLYGTRQ